MQAYYEIETEIPLNHQLHLKLPDSIPAGHAKIAVIYNLPDKSTDKAEQMAAFLRALPDEPKEAGLSREAIDDYLRQERQSWE
ncbi:hypothetical protein [Methylosarcina fibrata]|uniref:hypothetical protein n=1 Tax=Methylosarcina fibrata TaxID=105972 RepID=UPI000362EE9B|nr:hypothetical protein [Methylosarcina fibrata]